MTGGVRPSPSGSPSLSEALNSSEGALLSSVGEDGGVSPAADWALGLAPSELKPQAARSRTRSASPLRIRGVGEGRGVVENAKSALAAGAGAAAAGAGAIAKAAA
ncbi:MAG: hypothetical protein JKY65_32055, partial [Planctomycetes bacterium]|nr:hypothetical protein [Planctomycetota bacterium]